MYGRNSVSHLAPKIWEVIPNETKSCKSLNVFKEEFNYVHETYPESMCTMWVSFKFVRPLFTFYFVICSRFYL